MKTLLAISLLLSSQTFGAIVSGVVPEAERLFGFGDRPYDFDGDGNVDLTFRATSLDLQFLRVQPGGTTAFIVERSSFPSALAVLSYGTSVTVASDVYGGLLGQTMHISSLYAGGQGIVHSGPWAGQSGYMGFVFWSPIDPCAHYAWFRMAESGGVLELFEWAYETQDNTAIIAGHIPEPSQAALLAVPFVAFMGRRSRLRGAGMP